MTRTPVIATVAVASALAVAAGATGAPQTTAAKAPKPVSVAKFNGLKRQITALRKEFRALQKSVAEGALRGPAGPAGPTGPAGPAGATGPQGPAGVVAGLEALLPAATPVTSANQTFVSLDLPAGGSYLVQARCEALLIADDPTDQVAVDFTLLGGTEQILHEDVGIAADFSIASVDAGDEVWSAFRLVTAAAPVTVRLDARTTNLSPGGSAQLAGCAVSALQVTTATGATALS